MTRMKISIASSIVFGGLVLVVSPFGEFLIVSFVLPGAERVGDGGDD